MNLVSQVLAIVAVLSAGIIYGTDALGALVMRPALERVDERMLVKITGLTHYYGDRRFPLPGILSVVATVLTAVASAFGQRWAATIAAGAAAVILLVWLAIYFTVNAPINRRLTAAAMEDRVPENARALQRRWDSVINLRAVLQGAAVAALCVVLAAP
ncbi:DUF1772 domain-containing protein [Amycolatopsis sp.]|uniref:DUF1772 domain-containing protein n=1 Tax=Amycolatopsis sp. TaxID=37632 RepID=UPI002BA143F6|nr:DUF1772 domain-containing protein [Amycolatopsis sp.]HVV12239.1 DUF1772 domain-containing protein [Amycolatopsis sp.]